MEYGRDDELCRVIIYNGHVTHSVFLHQKLPIKRRGLPLGIRKLKKYLPGIPFQKLLHCRLDALGGGGNSGNPPPPPPLPVDEPVSKLNRFPPRAALGRPGIAMEKVCPSLRL